MRLGVDLGGTKIEIIALDASGRSLLRRRIDTPQGDYAATVETIRLLVEETEAKLGQCGSVGIGIPGAESRLTGHIKNANSTCLIDRPFKHDLEVALQREVRLANDANCFALSEASDGSAAGYETVFGVILGTGVGGGIVINGKPLVGANAIAGEWGHNPLPLPDPHDLPLRPCYCGRFGCVETYLSGPALSAEYARLSGDQCSPAEIAERAAQGDLFAESTLQHYERRLGRALAGVINLLDPDAIVFGGGLSNLARLYKNVPQLWLPHVFSDQVSTRLLPPLHGDSSGVRGAAWLWD